MNIKNVHIKKLAFLLILLVVLKFGINVLYEEGFFSIENINYSIITMKMEQITTDEFSQLLEYPHDETTPVLVYMGRKSCPVCIELLPIIHSAFEENCFLTNGEVVKQYYFDSERNKSKEAQKLRESIEANYVPSIIVIQKEKITIFDADDIKLGSISTELSNLLKLHS